MWIRTLTCLLILSATVFAEDSIIAPGAKLELLVDSCKFTEGPTCDGEGNIYFTDQPNNRILKWSVDGKLTTFLEPAGRTNGLCFDADGKLWACADEKNQIWRIDMNGNHEVMIKDFNGLLLNGPNDLWITPGGDIYFTDPYYKRPYWNREQDSLECNGIYHYSPKTGKTKRVIDDLVKPNGIIGTPDGKVLYVSDLGAKRTYAYDIQPSGELSGKRLFCEMGSDGMTVDDQGNVYLTNKGVTVFNPKGEKIEHIEVPEGWTANVCFGGKDRRTLFITAMDSLYGLKMQVGGVGSQ